MRAIKFWNLNLFAHDRKSPFHTPGLFQQFVLSHFLSIWLCNKADLGLVQDTQKIVVVALVNEKMECHILGWILFAVQSYFYTLTIAWYISSILFKECLINTGSAHLMRISLLPFFKTITKIWLMQFNGLSILLLRT